MIITDEDMPSLVVRYRRGEVTLADLREETGAGIPTLARKLRKEGVEIRKRGKPKGLTPGSRRHQRQMRKEAKAMQQPPTIGRIVHYVLSESDERAGEVRPAIIVREGHPLDHPSCPGQANLQVFLDGGNDGMEGLAGTMWKVGAMYSAEPKPGTWHWPPRV